ncbi:hypothetical protein [Pseudomonas knackmussii]|uniref:GAP1-N1 domain-containing protein n=1 Tax=Pseudomonas knackmussii TaxID=65741 RepID=UPI003F49C6E7
MANGVKGPRDLRVHQALHGYADGHRQLAISTVLKSKDQKTLLALSDISGPGAKLDNEGYITGYPLPESGFYALAKTWSAPEMPRPGCVWTHTLLIDFDDLATLDTLSFLVNAFKRPNSQSSTPHEYAEEALVKYVAEEQLSEKAIEWSKLALTALYGKPKSRIIISRHEMELDRVILAIWGQQWPRLRRGFRFCTFSASDRSTENSAFDLQVLPSFDRSVRSRFADTIDAENIKPAADAWVNVAIHDLKYPDKNGLRTFFRRLGSDFSGGREIFRALCRLYRAISIIPHNPAAINDAIALLQGELGSKHAKLAKSMLAKSAALMVESLDDSSFDFLWSNLGLIEPACLDITASKIGQVAWSRYPPRFTDLLNLDNDPDNTIFEKLFLGITIESLLEGLRKAPQLLEFALSKRPELINEQVFWAEGEEKAVSLMIAAKNLGLQSQAINALVKADRFDLAQAAANIFGKICVLEALAQTENIKENNLKVWIKVLAKDSELISGFLSNHAGVQRKFLHALAQAYHPDSIVNNYGDDPWLVAWTRSIGRITESENDFLMAYFLSRALGFQSRSQAELMQVSFDTVHSALIGERLSYESWRHLDALLPWSILWFAWDRCQRLRAGVANAFVTRDLIPLYFAKVTDDESLFYEISSSAAQSSRGRKYLSRVLSEMERDEARFHRRILTIKSLI